MNSPARYVTPDQLADHRGVTADAIRLACRNGTIPGAELKGRQWKIPAELLDADGAPDEWVSVQSVADFFNVTGEAIRQRCRAGSIDTVKVGGRYMIEPRVFADLQERGLP